MVKKFILLLPLVFALDISELRQKPVSSKHCYSYKCDRLNKVPKGSCVAFEDDVFHLQPCKGKQVCPAPLGPTFGTVKCEDPHPQLGLAYPEESCSSDAECKFGNCSSISRTCVGVKKNEACKSNSECASGLYCYQDKCTALIDKGEKGCTSTFECATETVCNFQNSLSGTCTQVFSVSNGQQVSDCVRGESFLCSSGACAKQGQTDVCVPAYKSPKRLLSCKSDDECDAKNSKGDVLEGSCECGYNGQGRAYCAVTIGDNAGQTYLQYMKKFYQWGYANKCNTDRRYNTECFRLSNYHEADEMIHAALYYNFHPQLQDNDSCVKKIYTSNYWSGAASLVIGLLAINLV